MYEPVGKCGSSCSGWQSLFSIEGRRMRAFKAAEATGDAMVVFVYSAYGSRCKVGWCSMPLSDY